MCVRVCFGLNGVETIGGAKTIEVTTNRRQVHKARQLRHPKKASARAILQNRWKPKG